MVRVEEEISEGVIDRRPERALRTLTLASKVCLCSVVAHVRLKLKLVKAARSSVEHILIPREFLTLEYPVLSLLVLALLQDGIFDNHQRFIDFSHGMASRGAPPRLVPKILGLFRFPTIVDRSFGLERDQLLLDACQRP